MAINISQSFKRTSWATRFTDDVLTKAQMLEWTTTQYPDGYLVVDSEEYNLYIFQSGATPSTETWLFVKVETWWWSGGTMWKTFVTNVAVWWIPAGTTINDTDEIATVIENMLVTYLAPTVTMSITPSTALYKKWTTVNITAFTATATKKSKPITKITFKAGWSTLEELTENVANWWTFTYSGTLPAITTDTTYAVDVTDWQETKTASKKVEFIVPFYWGASNTDTITSTTWLNEDLSKKWDKTYQITTAVQHATIVYPSSYGQLSNIKDQNNFDVISWFTTWTFEEGWETYRYYSETWATTDTNAKYQFFF